MTVAPKTVGKGYIPLDLISSTSEAQTVNSCKVSLKNGRLLVDGRQVNSFFFQEKGLVIIKSVHFTSQEHANEVRTFRRFTASEHDNYVYFLEEGFEDTLSLKELRHLSGAVSADRKFVVRFVVPASRIWVKIEKQHPVKFAIESGLSPKEVIEVVIGHA